MRVIDRLDLPLVVLVLLLILKSFLMVLQCTVFDFERGNESRADLRARRHINTATTHYALRALRHAAKPEVLK